MKSVSKFILKNIGICLGMVVTFFYTNLYGQVIPTPPKTPRGGTNPGEPVPIDMYEIGLLVIAVAMIIGFYYYSNLRKKASV